ncbi:hypothetical protein NDU88_009054 [Pleurodeles waltl]|uniref:Uncharacterized protein n=1 Tax=Pleurodeles waltl TaxID=8319 RepID=A0AAV7PU04_PLEWA|nr:hypothetical protein NDU88_009054 [Pleurodeles waltl]
MGTLSPRGRHSEVASTTTDDEDKANWPAGGQRPGIPQEEGVNEETVNEETVNEETANEETANEETVNEETANEETANEETANEETANEEAANEEEGAAIENGGATSEEKGGGNGRRGEPHNLEDSPEDGGRPRCPGTCDDDARGGGVVPEPEGTREQRGDHHRASHGPGGSWLWKVRSLWTSRGAP